MSLSISLNKPPGSPYMPGETIQGVVTVDMTGAKTCTCDLLSLTVQGTGHVGMVEVRHEYVNTGRGRTHRRTFYDSYKAYEDYLSGTINLLGKATLTRGRTMFPFQYSLPTEGLPMTYFASNGSVEYEIQVNMQRPGNEGDLHVEVPFIVGPVVDLNRISLAEYGPGRFLDEKSIERGTCCNSKIQTIGLEVFVPKRHFIPGELIQFTVNTENKCDLRLYSGTMELILTITCLAQGRVRAYPEILGQMAGPEVAPFSSGTWVVTNFMIPALKPDKMPPTTLGGCNIITAEYSLQYSTQLEHKDEGCCSDAGGRLDAYIPLIVGTIALNR